MCYVLYPFVTYLLTLPLIKIMRFLIQFSAGVTLVVTKPNLFNV
jgi:hypothetical protein